MAIHIINNVFVLETKNTHYVLGIDKNGNNRHIHWGKKCNIKDYEVKEIWDENSNHTSLDMAKQEYSVFGGIMYRESNLKVQFPDKCREIELEFVDAKAEDNLLTVTLRDKVYPLQIALKYKIQDNDDIITRWAEITNTGDKDITVDKMFSAELTLPSVSPYTFKNTNGSWGGEYVETESTLEGGALVFDSKRGTSGHNQSPYFIAYQNADEKQGDVYFGTLAYSGNFKVLCTRDLFYTTRVSLGLNDHDFKHILKANETFQTPMVFCGYSQNGFGEMSRQMNRFAINHVMPKQFNDKILPVLYNSWEATEFDVNCKHQTALAKLASKMGVELFVMDDGWFGKRDDDYSGLGDWFVNEKKLGCTLSELASGINEAGLKFGIWFEPECVSEDSDLYRAHPDYAFKMPGRKPTLGRHQLILDMSRKEVRDNIYNQLCKVLDSANISYVKWDFNRNITDLYSCEVDASRQGEIYHRYVLGLYELLERITTRYPDILFESCSGGGGRFDLGMHYFMPQAWTSDDTDPIERLKIQNGTSYIYPVSTMGAHVSASPNHQTGRETPLKTRGVVAYFGTYGLELDVTKMTREEKDEIKRQIVEFKKHYELIQRGKYYRLISPYDTEHLYCSWMVANDNEALVAIVKNKNTANSSDEIVRLKGLDKNAFYKINGEGAYLGGALMSHGLQIPSLWGEYQSTLIHLERI